MPVDELARRQGGRFCRNSYMATRPQSELLSLDDHATPPKNLRRANFDLPGRVLRVTSVSGCDKRWLPVLLGTVVASADALQIADQRTRIDELA
jgi:hypothetical protein